MISEPTYDALGAFGAALAWSVTSLLARTLIAHFGSVTINAVRSGIAGALLVVRVVATDGPGALTGQTPCLARSALNDLGPTDIGDHEISRQRRAGRAVVAYLKSYLCMVCAWLARGG